ncbi:Clavaminate synthase-like protein [Nemania abortiva]|nr:Clavaminate synthase-like protein [Nemania abortiva]
MPILDDSSPVGDVSEGLNGGMKSTKQSTTGSFSGVNVSASPMPGWPGLVDSRAAWDGSAMTDETYTYTLSEADILEIEAALSHFKDLGLDGEEVNRVNFPLPNLSKVLFSLASDLHFGLGFFALRGLDAARYSREDNVLIFLGVSSYVGEQHGKQDDSGHIFAHIREAKFMVHNQRSRPIRDSNLPSAFHTDPFCDILAMQTRSLAAKGGNHIVSSTLQVYHTLLAERSDLIPVLAAPNWPFDTRGILTPPDFRPLLYYHDGRIMMNFFRDPLTGVKGYARSENMPHLTPIQREALDFVQAAAQRYQRPLRMNPGDLTFINNLGLLHAREGFEDSEQHVRYLVRLWLKNAEMAWSLPAPLEIGNRRIYEDGGEVDEDWNIVYKPRLHFDVVERMSPFLSSVLFSLPPGHQIAPQSLSDPGFPLAAVGPTSSPYRSRANFLA